jgi:hypothetical protein
MGVLYRKKKERLIKLSHLLAAFIVLIHGYEKFEDEHITSGILFILCGLVFLSVAIFHHKLHQKVRSVDAIFAFLEGLAALILAIDFWGNKHYLQFAYLIAALIYISRSIFLYVKTKPTL